MAALGQCKAAADQNAAALQEMLSAAAARIETLQAEVREERRRVGDGGGWGERRVREEEERGSILDRGSLVARPLGVYV